MAIHVEGKGFASEAEPVGLLTEGAAGIATIVLAVIALAGIKVEALASITTIVIGIALIVQAFNNVAEHWKAAMDNPAMAQQRGQIGGEVMVNCLSGISGIVLGILALVGANAVHLVPAALVVFGGALLLSGGVSMWLAAVPMVPSAGQTQVVFYEGSAAASGMEILVGIAAIVLGILSLIMTATWVLVLVGFIAVGAALLMVGAAFSGAVLHLFTSTA